ncbi:MAG: indolepyruvate oxidoreductase subunit beta [Bacillota bacterium]
MNRDYLLCGVGGQGTILASKLLADAALNSGNKVCATETIGMSQRGGSVVSHVRVGSDTYSPMIPYGMAQVLIAFEPAEAVRNLPYLAENGVLVVAKKAVKPITATLSGDNYDGSNMISYLKENVKNLVIVDGETICANLGSNKVLNVVLLGAASASNMLGFSVSEMQEVIEKRVPQKFINLNRSALQAGASVVMSEVK